MPDYELDFWGTCANTWHEEEKQFAYASRMGLLALWRGAHPPVFDIGGRSVVDVGGGPVSLLLKCQNKGRAVVVDPSAFPEWVLARYSHCDIEYWRMEGESPSFSGYTFDEVWIYNTLQHVVDPIKVIENAKDIAKTLRIFEWIDIEPYDGHPHLLTELLLDEAIGSKGFTSRVDERGAVGRAYYGVFAVRRDS